MTTYTQQDIDDLLSKMALERGKLIVAAETLRGDDADRVPVDAVGEEQWTAKEQLAHLWEMERSYVAWWPSRPGRQRRRRQRRPRHPQSTSRSSKRPSTRSASCWMSSSANESERTTSFVRSCWSSSPTPP